jgi:PAS domain S-box-containing protein
MPTSDASRMSDERPAAGPQGYVVAVAAALLAVAVRWALNPLIGSEAGRYHTLLFALAGVGWRYGLFPSCAALAAGGMAAWYMLLPPTFSWTTVAGHWKSSMGFYVLSGAALAWLGDYIARVQLRSARSLQAALEGADEMAAIFQASNVAIAQTDPRTRRFLRVNPQMCALTGYSADELLQMTVDELNHPDDRTLDRAVFDGMQRGEQHYALEKRYLRKDGTTVWASVSGGTVCDADGRPRVAFGVAQDITRRKETEAALLESVSLLRAVCDHTSAPIFVKDRECRLLLANPATLAVFGRSQDEVLGSDLRELFANAAEAEAMLANDRRIMDTGVAETVEESLSTPDGTRIFQATKSPLRNDRDEVIGLIGVSREVTEQKRAEAELRQNEAEARLLQTISAELIHRDDVAAVFSKVVAGAQELMAAQAASLYVLNVPGAPQQGLRLLAKCGGDEPPLACWDCVDEQGLAPACSATLTTGERVVMPDVQLCATALDGGRNVCFEAGIRACQTTPLIGRDGELLGLLSTYWKHRHEPDERALRNLDLLARQAADLIERTHVEQALQASEARQKFLLELSDLLRPLADPVEIQRQAACAVGRCLRTHRVGYAEDQGDGGTLIVAPNFVDEVPPLEGTFRYADFGGALHEDLQAGRTVVRADPAVDSRLSPAEKAAHQRVNLGAAINVPLVKAGRLTAVMFAHHRTARAWTAAEIQLMEEAAERTWEAVERARAQAAVRASEEKYRMLFDSIDEGYLLAEVLFDAAGRPVDALHYDANPAALRLTGFDLIGKRLSEVDPHFE